MKKTGLLLVLYLALAFPALSQTTPSDRIDSLFRMFSKTTPGAAVVVVRDGEVIFENGYGMADLEHAVPISPETVFDVASVSKQFTGLAVATLVEQGVIDLDAPAHQYLPELPDFGQPLTVRHLVHHTSGLRDWPATLAAGGWRMDDVISFDQILQMAWNQKELNFEPGSEYSYSNTGYNLLAEIISRVTAKSFHQWTDDNIFSLLAMESSHFQEDHTELIPNRAFGYNFSGGAYRTVMNGLTAVGSSSLFSSAEDMAQWLINFDRHDIGGDAGIQRMRTRGILNSGASIDYAYGISGSTYKGLETWSHSGSWAGFRSHLLHFPEQRFGVVILSNFGGFSPAMPAYQIADIFLESDLSPPPPKNMDSDRSPVEVDTELLDDYSGTYRLGPGWYIEISRQSSRLFVRATGEARHPMVALSDSEFYVDAYNGAIHFDRDLDGDVSSITYREITAPRVPSFRTEEVKLSDYVGTYKSPELDTSYEIRVTDGKLEAVHFRLGSVVLSPVQWDEFASMAWFFSPVSFVRNESGSVTDMLIGRGRARNLRFVRLND